MNDKYKKTKLGWIPKEWEMVKLGEVAKKIGDGIHSTPKYSLNTNYFFINGNNLNNGQVTISEKTKCVDELEYNKYKIDINENTILYSINGTIGNIAFYNNEPVVLGKSAAYITTNSSKTVKAFLYYLLLSNNVKKYFDNELTGTTIRNLSLKSIRNLPIPLPPLPEQKKIAQILSTIDAKINNLSDQITETETLKKGLMQQLLTEGIGHSEFKDSKLGRIPRSWEVVKGENISTLITKGASPRWQGFEYSKKGLLFVTSENVKDGILDISKPKFLPFEFNKKVKKSQLKNGDILLNIVGASIGRACMYKSNYEVANINQAVCLIRPNQKIDSGFILYYLQHEDTINTLLGTQAGSARKNLSLSDIKRFNFSLPPLSEQKEIAKILSTVDAKLDVLRASRKEYAVLKKGMMQVLLTGEVRVN